MVPLVIVGAGGHGRDLQAIVEASPEYSFAGFLDDSVAHRDVVGRTYETLPTNVCWVVGINDPAARERLAKRITGGYPATLVHPSAVIGPGVVLGKGAVVAAGAVLDRDVFLGWHTHIHTGVTITRSWVLPYSTICPGATVCGDVVIGHGSTIGANATVRNLRSVGHRCTVGAGAVVTEHVPNDATAVGVPACW